jgi:hypothetical protein
MALTGTGLEQLAARVQALAGVPQRATTRAVDMLNAGSPGRTPVAQVSAGSITLLRPPAPPGWAQAVSDALDAEFTKAGG